MIKHIHVPAFVEDASVEVLDVHIKEGARLRRGMVMVTLRQDGVLLPIRAELDGWIRFVATKSKQTLSKGDLLLVVDMVETTDYRVDPNEFNTSTELGHDGRRGLERAGQKVFGEHARALFEESTVTLRHILAHAPAKLVSPCSPFPAKGGGNAADLRRDKKKGREKRALSLLVVYP